MARTIHDLGPRHSDTEWRRAQGLLQASETAIGHIDTGLFPHKTLGFADDGTPPGNILLHIGKNLFDPKPNNARPVTDLSIASGKIAKASEYPDHGVKTLSIILANRPEELIGVAPGAKIIPYRIANGPVFIGRADTRGIGAAMEHAMALPSPPRVFSISMGNPGFTGLSELFRPILGGNPGMAAQTVEAVNRAYDLGIVTVAAGGQVINNVSYPARFARTIAVGGITTDETHYPLGGYDNADLIDVWAYASNINRAAGARLANGSIQQTHADDPGSDDSEPSGTSYAAPQVSAAAALWVTRWARELAALAEPWMVVEAFRHALRSSARRDRIRLSRHRGGTIIVRRLDIESLLRRPPEPNAPLSKRSRSSAHGSWL
ncbi:MAG: S8/S53 family peptidase [Paracoccaceae bacterium]